MSYHPMQPIELDEHGTPRFRENKIIRWLVDSGKLNLNEIGLMPFSREDQMQIAQLIGYSVSGFGDLSYADPDIVAKADEIAASLIEREV